MPTVGGWGRSNCRHERFRPPGAGTGGTRVRLDACPGRAVARSAVEIEVAGRLLLEPQAIVVRRLLEELGRLLQHVLVLLALLAGRSTRLLGWGPGGTGGRRLGSA